MTEHSLRGRWPLLAVIILLLAVIGVVVLVPHRHDVVVGKAACLPRVDVFVADNQRMSEVAAGLRTDRRVISLTTETKEQAYARFRRIFADNPDILRTASPAAFPAAVHLALVSGTDPWAFIGDARKQFAEPRYEVPSCVTDLKPPQAR